MKTVINKILNIFGLQLSRKPKSRFSPDQFEPGGRRRPVGKIELFLEDLAYRNFYPKVIYDLGANNGAWTSDCMRTFPDAKYYLFEPQYEMHKILENVYCGADNVQVLKFGIGRTCEQKVLTIWEDLAGSSFLPDVNSTFLNSGKQRILDIKSLDYLVDSKLVELPNLVKMDIQGFELEALQGSSKLFGYTDIFILETSFYRYNSPSHPIANEIIDFMWKNDYVLYDFAGFSRRPLDGALGQCDMVFVHINSELYKNHSWE